MGLFGKSKRKQAEEYAAYVASPETQWVWVQGQDGPQALPGRRVPGGIVAYGRVYPDEFLLHTGRANYWVGTHYMVPKDGDYSHVGDLREEDLVEAPANRVLVWWWQMCAAREQANLNKLLEPANPQGKTLGLVMKTVVIVAAIVTMYSTWGMKGEMTRAADTSTSLAGAVERLDKRVNATPGPGAPASFAPVSPMQPAPAQPQLPPVEPGAPMPGVQGALPTAPPQPACGRDPRLGPGEPTATCAAADPGHEHKHSPEEGNDLADDAGLKGKDRSNGHALDRARRQQTPVAGGHD